MGFFDKFVSAILRVRPGKRSPIDENTKNLLMSAVGNVGGDLCDLLLPVTQTDDQAIVVSWETAFLGIAAACHFFTVRHASESPTLLLATEVADVYRKQNLKHNTANLGSDEAARIDQYFTAQSQHALATMLGVFSDLAMHPEKLSFLGAFSELAEYPDKLSLELSKLLAKRVRSNGALVLDIKLMDQARETIDRSLYALVGTFETLMGTGTNKRSLSAEEIFSRAQSCLGELLIQYDQGKFQRIVEIGYLGFTAESVYYCADFDSIDSDTICYVKLSDFPMLKAIRPTLEIDSVPMIPGELFITCVQISKSVKPWKG